MMDMIHSRKQTGTMEEHHDLFSSLLSAADDESEGEPRLADSELIGTVLFHLNPRCAPN